MKKRQCPEGLIINKVTGYSATAEDMIVRTETEYRCEHDLDHVEPWHEEGDFKWQT